MKDNFKMIQISNKAVEVRMKNDQNQNSYQDENYQQIEVETINEILYLRINREKKLNALNSDVLYELKVALSKVKEREVLFTGLSLNFWLILM